MMGTSTSENASEVRTPFDLFSEQTVAKEILATNKLLDIDCDRNILIIAIQYDLTKNHGLLR